MFWIDDNKGAGPWPFTEQLDKWGYLNNPRWTDEPEAPVNYTGREDEEPQIWDIGDQNSHVIVSNEFSKDHKPCGHWHKKSIAVPPPPPGDTPEIYWELLDSQPAEVQLIYPNEVTSIASFVQINTEEFDGDITWNWEVIGFNKYTFDVAVQVIDDYWNVCGEVILAAGTEGATGSELFRTRVDFVPSLGSRSYGLRLTKAEGDYIPFYPLKIFLTTARIIVKQENATKTKIQIPLMGSFCNYNLEESDSYPHDFPMGHSPSEAMPDFTDHWGDSEYFTTLWKFSKSELDNVSKAVFCVTAVGHLPAQQYSKTLYVTATVPIDRFHLMLYRPPPGSPTGACMQGVPYSWVSDEQVHTDVCTDTVFTPIPDSMIYWETSPYPYNITVYPDFSGITGNLNFHLGGEINDGVWGQFGKWFNIDIPENVTLTDVSLTVESTALPNQNKWTFRYRKILAADLDFTIALWNKTNDCLVVGSELVWAKEEGPSQKTTEFAVSELKNSCEYELVAKCPDYIYYSPKVGQDPELIDVQLWLNVDPISMLTVWQRCARVYEVNHDNYYIPNSWGTDYWGGSNGSISIGCRVKLMLPAGTTIYYEQTAYDKENYGGEVIEDLYCTILEDLGKDINSGEAGVDVEDGKLIWNPATYYHKRARLRTGALSLIDGHCYSVRSPDVDYYTIIHNNGFIVISVNFRDIK